MGIQPNDPIERPSDWCATTERIMLNTNILGLGLRRSDGAGKM
jgi:hypothetical protein